MRIRSYSELGLLGAVVFILGWLSGSSLAPPVATTAGRVADQLHVTPRTPRIPRVDRLPARAPLDPPRTRRNPFAFEAAAERVARSASPSTHRPPVDEDDPRGESVEADAPVAPAAPWRMVGVASGDDGAWTAILTGGGDVQLVRVADSLPGGWTVVSVDAAGVTLRGPDGVTHALTLP